MLIDGLTYNNCHAVQQQQKYFWLVISTARVKNFGAITELISPSYVSKVLVHFRSFFCYQLLHSCSFSCFQSLFIVTLLFLMHFIVFRCISEVGKMFNMSPVLLFSFP